MDFQRNRGPSFSDFLNQIKSSKTLEEIKSLLDSIEKNHIQIPSMTQHEKQGIINAIWEGVEYLINESAQKTEIEESAKLVCAKITGCP